MKNLIYILPAMLLLASCSVEKRVHMTGYHIEWKKSKANYEEQQIANNQDDDEILVVQQWESQQKANENSPTSTDDNLTASIDNPITLPAPKMALIGKKQMSATKESETRQQDKTLIANKTTKTKDKADKTHVAGGKLQIVALVLCFFLGGIGIHRFYLGYTGLGVLYIFTAALFGIGWLIDLILLIIPNGLSPKGKDSYND